jgi:hypothetical protein
MIGLRDPIKDKMVNSNESDKWTAQSDNNIGLDRNCAQCQQVGRKVKTPIEPETAVTRPIKDIGKFSDEITKQHHHNNMLVRNSWSRQFNLFFMSTRLQ